MADIKPIETVYNGYRFRSRLEARWAVFFYAAGIKYEYEPEGFDLGDGVHYLPDFYLPWFKAYVEIKSSNISIADNINAKKKLEKLVLGSDDQICAVYCEGDPLEDNMEIFTGFCDALKEEPEVAYQWSKARFIEGAWYNEPITWRDESGGWHYEISEKGVSKHHIDIAVGPFSNEPEEHFEDDYIYDFFGGNNLIYAWQIYDWRSMLESAKRKARQARFEHGETTKAG